MAVHAAGDLHLVSVNVGRPREIELRDRVVVTSIYKSPTTSRVAVRGHNLEGDRQADLRVHGGPYKAVYAYPSEHYSYWGAQLPEMPLTYGAFGENLTTAGLLEEEVAIGDQFRIGSTILEVTQPRMPCFKLALRFGQSDMVKRFWRSGFSGFYLSVLQEGELGVEDKVERLTTVKPGRITIAEVVGLHKGAITDQDVFERALAAPLRGSWKQDIRERWQASSLSLF
jgi:MOSC domain-containing protein YiiM